MFLFLAYVPATFGTVSVTFEPGPVGVTPVGPVGVPIPSLQAPAASATHSASPHVVARTVSISCRPPLPLHIDCHVEIDGHYYSVPHALVRRQLDVRLTARTVECFHRGQRVASHVRSSHKGRHTTTTEPMPEKHRQMGDWPPDRFIRWAEKIGPATAALITAVLNSRRHPQQAYRSCRGLLRLTKCHGDARLEAAATRARRVSRR